MILSGCNVDNLRSDTKTHATCQHHIHSITTSNIANTLETRSKSTAFQWLPSWKLLKYYLPLSYSIVMVSKGTCNFHNKFGTRFHCTCKYIPVALWAKLVCYNRISGGSYEGQQVLCESLWVAERCVSHLLFGYDGAAHPRCGKGGLQPLAVHPLLLDWGCLHLRSPHGQGRLCNHDRTGIAKFVVNTRLSNHWNIDNILQSL